MNATAGGLPVVSVTIRRLRPFVFLLAAKPSAIETETVFTLWESIIA